jgi:hypothetical protein
MSRDILHAFDDMRIPPPLAEKLRPLFDEVGLELGDAVIDDPFNPNQETILYGRRPVPAGRSATG